MQQALPEYVPAVRRARALRTRRPRRLSTAGEMAARQALDKLEIHYVAEKLPLEQDLDEARSHKPLRYRLLYGTGARLSVWLHEEALVVRHGRQVLVLDNA